MTKTSAWYNLEYMLRLVKSNLFKLVWHHATSVYWEIAALIVGSAEIEGVRFDPGVNLASPYSKQRIFNAVYTDDHS